MDKFTIRQLITETLTEIHLYSDAALNLLLGTGAHESLNWQYRRQMGNGPALGLFQMEPFTHDDCWNNYLNYYPKLAQSILMVSGMLVPDSSALETNDVYAICMARVKYLRDPQPIPTDLHGQAAYWKRVYNTHLGKGTVEEYITHYNKYVA